ncbi:MAG: HAD hydrolase family protein [Candidatus Nitrosopelagicus sp.]|nr:HAD hydrolase family protein [Candidatus Nitrosopelagicus sp.]
MKKELKLRLKKIKLVITDVDGVLTDGGMYYTEEGDIMKRFHARDGMGVTLLRNAGISTIIVTKEKTKMVKIWSKKMKIKKLLDGIKEKEKTLTKICRDNHVVLNEIAYIGDDVNDFKILKKIGFAVTPSDGIDSIKKICHHVCSNNGGHGAFRELADLVLEVKNGD